MALIRWIYLAAYVAVIGAAVATLWRAGILSRLPGTWVAAAVAIAVLLGVGFGLAFRPMKTRDD